MTHNTVAMCHYKIYTPLFPISFIFSPFLSFSPFYLFPLLTKLFTPLIEKTVKFAHRVSDYTVNLLLNEK